ncbi:hypothetical protein D3C85_1118030 [compost metagenome]
MPVFENISVTVLAPASVRDVVCSSYGSARDGRVPVTCAGRAGVAGTGIAADAFCVSARLSTVTLVLRPASVGRASLFGLTKLKAEVRSPHTARR